MEINLTKNHQHEFYNKKHRDESNQKKTMGINLTKKHREEFNTKLRRKIL